MSEAGAISQEPAVTQPVERYEPYLRSYEFTRMSGAKDIADEVCMLTVESGSFVLAAAYDALALEYMAQGETIKLLDKRLSQAEAQLADAVRYQVEHNMKYGRCGETAARLASAVECLREVATGKANFDPWGTAREWLRESGYEA